MAASGHLGDLVGTGRVISVLFVINGIRNKRSHLIGPPFQAFKARFSAIAVWHLSRNLCRCLLIGGCGRSQYPLRIADITSGSSFEPNNSTEQKLGYV